MRSLLDAVRCPRCMSALDVRAAAITCGGCGQAYPRLGQIPILVSNPDVYLSSCRQQLALLRQQVDETVQTIEEQSHMADMLPATISRCREMIEALQGQVEDICGVLERLFPAGDIPNVSDNGALPAPLQYLHYLYRDWGWPEEANGENERALAAVEAVLERQPLGRTLVVGAGACRLAYDLHRRNRSAATTVIDIDAFLFAAAHEIIRGKTISLREANAEIDELPHVAKKWILSAPNGAIDDSRFHFILADGLEPPLASERFDTVVTPWFIDLVPADLRDFISTVHRLLKPGGRWLNLGPLRYQPHVPAALRFTREEVFELSERAGFRIGRWQSESMPYLVSKLNGRGKVEWVLAFAATKLETTAVPNDSSDRPPRWLLFRHLPIPAFTGQSLFWSKAPLVQIVIHAIDGKRTLDDLAHLVAANARESGLSMDEIRGAVRRCIAENHPACQS